MIHTFSELYTNRYVILILKQIKTIDESRNEQTLTTMENNKHAEKLVRVGRNIHRHIHSHKIYTYINCIYYSNITRVGYKLPISD